MLGYYMPVSFCLSLPPCVVCAVLRCRWFFNQLLKQKIPAHGSTFENTTTASYGRRFETPKLHLELNTTTIGPISNVHTV